MHQWTGNNYIVVIVINQDTCFKLHGYPEWYKDLSEQRKKAGTGARAFTVNSTELRTDTPKGTSADGSLSEMMSELLQIMKGKGKGKAPLDPVKVNFARFDEFAGNGYTDSSSNVMGTNSWNVDTGATNHICADAKLFDTLDSAAQNITIHLPDGTTRVVTHTGNIKLSQNITLNHTLHVPSFHFNLLSVGKLCKNLIYQFHIP